MIQRSIAGTPALHHQHLSHTVAEVSVAFPSLEQVKSTVQDKVTATQHTCASPMALPSPASHPAWVPAAFLPGARVLPLRAHLGLIVLKQMTLFI